MPPALEKLIPITQPSSQPYISQNFKKPKRRVASRVYDEHYLPIAPSQLAPRHATITSRIADAGQVAFSLDIGGVEIGDVGVHEILDYVSAFELERFENAQFAEERELLSILEEEAKQERQARRQFKRRQLEQQVGSLESSEEESSDDAGVPIQAEAAPPAVGKHGRARPTYKHLYLQPKVRRRRKRDPDTGELLSLSEDDGGFVTQAAIQEFPAGKPTKRRRRKRDKITGDLLPLSPESAPEIKTKPKKAASFVDPPPAVAGYVQDPNKRPRRRRHPITNELMPLGWKYDPAADALLVSSGDAFKYLSIAGQEQPSAKRPRLQSSLSTTRESSESLSNGGRHLVPSIVIDRIDSTTTSTCRSDKRASVKTSSLPVINMSDSDDAIIDTNVPSRTRTSLTNPNIRRRSSNSSQASSTDRITVSSFQKPRDKAGGLQARGKTSMLNPTITPADQSAGDSDEDSDDGEFVIEGIIQHRMSDPKTHLPEFGHKSIRLYQVKWEGYDELTWEPIESFPDRSIVAEYHQRVGLKHGDSRLSAVATTIASREKYPAKTAAGPLPVPSNDDKPPTESKSSTKPPIDNKPPANNKPPRSNRLLPQLPRESVSTIKDIRNANGSRHDSSSPPSPKTEYVVEAILGHHMSDPKTHPSHVGEKPVMLYHVKWRGYDELTWEPIESFPVRSIALEYRERHGLHRTEANVSVGRPRARERSTSRVEVPPSPALKSPPQDDQKKEQQRMQWNALMAASQKSGKSAQQLQGDDSSDD